MTANEDEDVSTTIAAWWADLETFGFRGGFVVSNGEEEEEEEVQEFAVVDPTEGVPLEVRRKESGEQEEEEEELVAETALGPVVISGNYYKKVTSHGEGHLLRGVASLSGPGLERRGIRCIVGKYRGGKLSGRGKVLLLSDDLTLEGEFVSGRLVGPVVGSDPETGATVAVGVFDGRGRACRAAPFWRRTEGGGFLYGRLDPDGRFGSGNDDDAFVYPDLRTALVGRFRHGRMEEARERLVVGVVSDGGLVLRLRFSPPREAGGDPAVFAYRPSTLREIRCPPLQEDPLERNTVRVGPSTLGKGAGEGLFARGRLSRGDTVAFYNGLRVRPGETPPSRSIHYEIYVDWCHATSGGDSDYMDLPSPLEQTRHYRASLGHKINHSFRPNCRWSVAAHPVFGRVPAVVAISEVAPGEELTCHYMIDMGEAGGNPQFDWYVREWERASKEKEEEAGSDRNNNNDYSNKVEDVLSTCESRVAV